MKKLVILDINGILCRKIDKNDNNTNLPNLITLPSYLVQIRPDVDKLLTYLYDNYEVGFFSSTTYTNCSKILDAILTKKQYKKALFFWYRDRTHFDPNTSNSHETVKLLEDIYTNPIINAKRLWSNKNTIIIDDSPQKNRFNNPANVIIIPSFTGDDDSVLNLIDLINDRFMKL